MTAAAWAWALLAPIALGGALVRCLAPEWPRSLVLAAGAAVGPALTSLAHVGLLVVAGPPGLLGVAVEAAALVALLALARRRAREAPGPSSVGARPTPLERGLALGLLLVAAGFVVSFSAHALSVPHGSWDAFAIWNLRARTLVRCGGDLSLLYVDDATPADHLDYPLAVPAAVARGWGLVGESRLVPALLALQAALSTVAVVGATLGRLRGRSLGLLGAALVLATPSLAARTASQCADVPLCALFATAAAALLCAEGAARGALVVAGLAAGLGAWTKNEGAVFAIGVVCAAGLLDPRSRAGGAALALLGAAPALLAVTLHHAVAPTNDLVAGQGAATAARLLDPGRWLAAVRGLFGALLGLWPAVPLAAGVVLLGLRPPPRPRAAGLIVALLVVQLAAYVVVYVTTPWDLAWHLDTSRERLALHVWPAAVLVALATARRPGSAGGEPAG